MLARPPRADAESHKIEDFDAILRLLGRRAAPRLRWGLFLGNFDAAHYTVDGVGGFDLTAGDAKEKQHGIQVGMA
ncbi:hypothetical protein MB901379_01469 [Mycobacterium basiliense]|uniref:Uncharacterized protein n=1 Tax=Mycobacterium basiliense TaxID=2094119 RepID=A0A3S4DS68_9MYCO|nr:hypothetical protein MB901379_01469 [Mycobacterium basiliense]